MRRTLAVSLVLIAAAVLAASSLSRPAAAEEWKNSALSADRARRFDFWVGQWDVNLRIQQEDSSWKDSVAARAEISSILNGKAVLELWDSEPIKGFSLRYFDPAKEKWVLWLNWPGQNRSGSSSLEGEFRHGRGDFYSEATDGEGNKLLSRYSFNDIGPDSLRWDDGYSRDGGKTWSHQWVMEFSRRAAEPALPDGDEGHTYGSGGLCDQAEFRSYEYLAGNWSGEVVALGGGAGEPTPAHWRGLKVLGGCAVLVWSEYPIGEDPLGGFSQITYNTHAGRYELLLLDNLPGSSMQVLYGEAVGDAIDFFHRPSREAEPDYKLRLGPTEDGGVSQDLYRPDPNEESGWLRVAGMVLHRR